MNCLHSPGRCDRGFESHLGHGCLVFTFILCLCCVKVEALQRVDLPSKKSYRLSKNQETEVKRVFHGSPMLPIERQELRKYRSLMSCYPDSFVFFYNLFCENYSLTIFPFNLIS
jgi:hypothetical protein